MDGGGLRAGRVVYSTLMARGTGDRLNRHLFACLLTSAMLDRRVSLARSLGLDKTALRSLFAAYFPAADWLDNGPPGTPGPLAPEEEDLIALLCQHGSCGAAEEQWLARCLARRALLPNHLWQDLGLRHRSDLSQLMTRHFAPLAARNDRDMKWKKFFYRTLCEAEGVLICRSPVCSSCDDYAACFGPETGAELFSHS